MTNTQSNSTLDIETYGLTKPDGFSQSDYRTYLLILRLQVVYLKADGWSRQAIREVYIRTAEKGLNLNQSVQQQLEGHFTSLHRFGSQIFQEMWLWESRCRKSPADKQELLKLALRYVRMPEELSGRPEEIRELLARFSDQLPPDDKFWKLFAREVRQAYPAGTLSDQSGDKKLKRRVHQFRYIVSAYQAQWVRGRYRTEGMTDAEALAVYLKDRGAKSNIFVRLFFRWFIYRLRVSSRLHNKRALGKGGQIVYPDGLDQVNFKVLMGVHTEFILSESGAFLNETDPEGSEENGLLNGASFNYAGFSAKGHEELDVRPVKPYDPAFRNKAVANGGSRYRNPSPKAYRSKSDKIYGNGRTSLKVRVKKARQAFENLIASC